MSTKHPRAGPLSAAARQPDPAAEDGAAEPAQPSDGPQDLRTAWLSYAEAIAELEGAGATPGALPRCAN